MTRKNKTLTLYIVYLVLCSSIFTTGIILNLLGTINNSLFGSATLLVYFLSLALIIVFGFGIILSTVALNSQRRFLKQLTLQNTYSLGHNSAFYDISAFKARAYALSKSRRLSKNKQYLIAFTVASLDVSANSFKNNDITELNYQVSVYLSELFEKGKGFENKKYNVFAFDRGVFLIFTFCNNEDYIKDLVNKIIARIYELLKEKELKVWAQPFFGVRETNSEENLISAIEDALSARTNGEVNFESYTLYHKDTQVDETGIIRLDEILSAIENEEFIPYYQPKFNLKKKEFVSAEVLARWQSPTRGLLTPNSFISKAEQYGLISRIDLLIFEKSLRDISNSIRRGRRVIPISANFSLYEFFSHSFLDTIVGLLEKYQVPATLVEIEITESTSQVNQFLSISVIKKLKEKGIRVLMDDYGVGYSQISTFKNIPFDGIKIDKSYTDEVLTDEKVRSIFKFLVELGHINDLEVIVEGAEKKEQVDILRKMHVDTIQGFYYSKALPYAEYEALLKDNKIEGGK